MPEPLPRELFAVIDKIRLDATFKALAAVDTARQKREADPIHKRKIKASAAQSIESLGVPAAKAGELVEAIDQNLIANVTINY